MDTVIPKIIFPELFIGLVAPVGANINSSILAFRKYFEANTYLVEEIRVTDIFPVMGKYVKPKIPLSTPSEFDHYSTYIKYGDQEINCESTLIPRARQGRADPYRP